MHSQINGDSSVFSKDWTNLFTSKIEENFVCVLSFKYKKFTFVIKKDPTVHSRKLSHLHWLEVEKDVADKSVNAYFYEQFEYVENTNLALNYGNLSKIRSAAVLRKAKFDLSSLQRYSNDNWVELISLQQYYRNSVIGLHYIKTKSLSHNPFIVHLYTENQIKILKLFKDTRIVLHLDATGSIVRKIEPSLKKIFYYALTEDILPTPLVQFHLQK